MSTSEGEGELMKDARARITFSIAAHHLRQYSAMALDHAYIARDAASIATLLPKKANLASRL